MHNRELEEQLREQLEESRECIERLLSHLDTLWEENILTYGESINNIVYNDAEKFLEKLNEK